MLTWWGGNLTSGNGFVSRGGVRSAVTGRQRPLLGYVGSDAHGVLPIKVLPLVCRIETWV